MRRRLAARSSSVSGRGAADEREASDRRPREVEGALGGDPLAAAGDEQHVPGTERQRAVCKLQLPQHWHGSPAAGAELDLAVADR